MKSIALGLLVQWLIVVVRCQNKRCKNIAECYSEAMEGVSQEREELREIVNSSGPDRKKIIEEVRRSVLANTLVDKDKKIKELEDQLSDQKEVIKKLVEQLGKLKNYIEIVGMDIEKES